GDDVDHVDLQEGGDRQQTSDRHMQALEGAQRSPAVVPDVGERNLEDEGPRLDQEWPPPDCEHRGPEMAPEAHQQHGDEEDRDRRTDAEIERHEVSEPMGQSVVATALPHVTKELDRGSKLAGPTDQAGNQDV